MKKEKINPIAQFVVLLLLYAVAYFGYVDDPETQLYLYKLSVGLGIAIMVSIMVWLIMNYRLVWYAIKTHMPWSFYRPIRITVAYLFRIEVDGKYMLVKNNRGISGFQPVGGVYKYLRRENAERFDELGLIADTKIPRDVIAEDDLRMQMKKRHHLLGFIRWFATKKHREVDPWREFYEELVRPGILSHDNFPHIQYRHVRQHTQLTYSDHHEINEYRVADIYELQLSTEAQKQEIRNLMQVGGEDVMFATAEEIKQRKQGEKLIAEHTYKII